MKRSISLAGVAGFALSGCGGGAANQPTSPAPGPASAPAAVNLHFDGEDHLANLRQITASGENAEAYWSWDGGQLIMQSTHGERQCDQIYTVPIDNGPADMTMVSTGKGRTTCSYFFPGNRHILYASTHEVSPDCPPKPDMSQGYVWALYDSYDIFTAKSDGTELKNITHSPGYDAEATVCAKDGSIIFTTSRDGDLELYRMDADGSNVVRLTHTPGYDGGAYFSPDCSKIVWRASRPQPGPELEDYQRLLKDHLVRPTTLEIWVANADGSDAHQVTYLDAASFGPSWFPSGDRIIFASNVADPQRRDFDLWAVNENGTGLERITFAPEFDGFPMFSPDGKHLAFASNRHGKVKGETDVYVADWVDSPPAAKALEERAPDRYYRDVAWLADDAREGRGVGTKGLDAAADYLEARFRLLGLLPAGDNGTFRQKFEVTTAVRVGATTTLAVDGKPVAADAFVPAGFSISASVTAPVVLAGYGVTAADLGADDYKGLDVKGKVVLVKRFAPEGGRFEEHAQRRYSEPRYKAWNAREHGAKAVIIADLGDEVIATPGKKGAPASQPKEARKEQPLPHVAPDTLGDAGIPVIFMTRAEAEKLLHGKHKVALTVALESDKTTAYNIVARVPAGGAKQPGVVVVGAHYDHLGYGGPASLAPGAHEIHHGADDNGSGTAGLLEVAHDLAAEKDKLDHDVLLVGFSGEEMGTLGSTAFTRSPPGGLAMKDVRAMLNMDMIGRLRENKLQVIGNDTADEWRTAVEAACKKARIECTLGNGGYGPSDQTPFYASGVPILYFFTGSHREYHKPTDVAALINAGGGAQIAGLVADLTVAAATAPKLTYKASVAPEPIGDLRAAGASMGTVPDYVGPPTGQTGVLLAGVRPGGPADQAGMKRGDILVKIDGHDIRTVEDFMFVLQRSKPGEKGKVKVLRDGKPVELEVTFGAPTMR